MQARLADLAALLGGELCGDGNAVVSRIGALDRADAQTIGFLAHPRYLSQLQATAAGCVIVAPAQREAAASRGAAIVCEDPYLAFAKLTQWWARHTRRPAAPGVHSSAVVEPGAVIHPSASIGAMAFVGASARLAAGAVVGAQAGGGELPAARGARGRWLVGWGEGRGGA